MLTTLTGTVAIHMLVTNVSVLRKLLLIRAVPGSQTSNEPKTIPEPSSHNPDVPRSMMLASSSPAQVFKAQDMLEPKLPSTLALQASSLSDTWIRERRASCLNIFDLHVQGFGEDVDGL